MSDDEPVGYCGVCGTDVPMSATHKGRHFSPDCNGVIEALAAERERADRAEAALECGHPASLMLHSAETGEPLYCELCDMRSQRNDAVQMEEHYKAERDALRDRLGLKNKPIPTVHGARGKE